MFNIKAAGANIHLDQSTELAVWSWQFAQMSSHKIMCLFQTVLPILGGNFQHTKYTTFLYLKISTTYERYGDGNKQKKPPPI